VIPGTRVRPQAAADAEEIFAYLVKQSVPVARRFMEAAADTPIAIRDDPTLGIRWHNRSGCLTKLRWKRVQGFKKYLIFYRMDGDVVVVQRILHGARNIDQLLDAED